MISSRLNEIYDDNGDDESMKCVRYLYELSFIIHANFVDQLLSIEIYILSIFFKLVHFALVYTFNEPYLSSQIKN